MTFRFFTKTTGAAAVAVCVMLGMLEPAQSSDSYYDRVCENSWGKSDAAAYCPNPVVNWYSGKKGRVSCAVRATCIVNVRVGDSERQFSEELDSPGPTLNRLTICFKSRRNADGNLDWRMGLHGYCGSHTDVATAVADGLPAN